MDTWLHCWCCWCYDAVIGCRFRHAAPMSQWRRSFSVTPVVTGGRYVRLCTSLFSQWPITVLDHEEWTYNGQLGAESRGRATGQEMRGKAPKAEWVCSVYRPTRHIIGHFGDESWTPFCIITTWGVGQFVLKSVFAKQNPAFIDIRLRPRCACIWLPMLSAANPCRRHAHYGQTWRYP